MSLKNKEIAKILNISPAAVSLALNNKYGVSEETRRKAIALRNGSIAATLGDTKLSESDQGMLLFCVLKKHGRVISDTPFFLSLSESLHQQVTIEGYSMQTFYYRPGLNMQEFIGSIDITKFKGILLLATEATMEDINLFKNLGLPLLVIDSWFGSGKVDSVLMDNAEGIDQALNYAYSCGHRKIGFIRGGLDVNNFEERYWAYHTGIERLGLDYEEKFVFSIQSTIDGSFNEMTEILKNKPELPTVFICSNDIIALGAMNALKNAGYSIPSDISIIGFDDMPTTQLVNPALTSVRIYNRRIARMAVEVLVDRIRQRDLAKEYVRCLVGVDIMIRDSVKVIS